MPQGLQVWDASGNLQVDTNTTMANVLGTVSSGTTNGSLTDANFAKGTPFAIAMPATTTFATAGLYISFAGNVMTWTWDTTGTKAAQTIVYGFQ